MAQARSLEQLFPGLVRSGYKERSPDTPRYNCVAFAAGDDQRFWGPLRARLGGYFWPAGVSTENTLENWIAAFHTVGYAVCDSYELEAGYEKSSWLQPPVRAAED